jgi:hypothetical protein
MTLLLFVKNDEIAAKLVRKNPTSDYKRKFLELQGRARLPKLLTGQVTG